MEYISYAELDGAQQCKRRAYLVAHIEKGVHDFTELIHLLKSSQIRQNLILKIAERIESR